MSSPVSRACAARLPEAALPALARLRARREVRAVVAGGELWISWPLGSTPGVLESVQPLPGVRLLERREGRLHLLGARLPLGPSPLDGELEPLSALVVPAPVPLAPSPEGELGALPLGLVRDDRPRPPSAERARLEALARWADHATTRQLATVVAARTGADVLLRPHGGRLPHLASSVLFWGDRVLAPLGLRADPPLAESAWLEAAGAAPNELLLLSGERRDLVPLDAFLPLTRGAVRLAARETAP